MSIPTFVLRFSPRGEVGQYEVWAEGYTLHREVDLTPTPEVHSALARLYERGVDRVHKSLDEQDIDSSLVGRFLYDRVISGSSFAEEFRNRFEPGGNAARLSLYLPPSLYTLPWELLLDREGHGENQYISLHHSLVRYDASRFIESITTLKQPSPIKQYLYVHSDAPDLNTGTAKPRLTTQSVSFTYQYPGYFDAFNDYVEKERRRFAKTDAFIFLGHGTRSTIGHAVHSSLVFVRERTLTSRILERREIRQRDPRSAVMVGTALAMCKDLNFAIILACESAWTDPAFPFSQSIVGTFLAQTKIPILLGAQCRIGAQAAIEFLDHFLVNLHSDDDDDPALAPGEKRFDELVTYARRNLRSSSDVNEGNFPTALDWWIPVLYAQTQRLVVNNTNLEESLPAIRAART